MSRFFSIGFLALLLFLARNAAGVSAEEMRDSAQTKVNRVSELPKSSDSAKIAVGRADSVVIVKHHFNHREQIITGSVIMTCLVSMMAIMNNYNPK